MTEDHQPMNDSPETVAAEQHHYAPVAESPSPTGWKIAIVLCAFLAAITAGYAWLQHDAADQLAAEREDLRSSLAQSKSREDALATRVNELSLAQAQAQEQAARAHDLATQSQSETVDNQSAAPTVAVPKPKAHIVAHHHAAADDPRWKQVQQQLGDQQKQLADAQQQLAQSNQQIAKTQTDLDQAKTDLSGNLETAKNELGGDIARNHEEVVALQKKGERTYYEFTFDKPKSYQHTGSISLGLRKSDTKHAYCDLDLVVDDKTMTRKHVNLYESIALYPEGYTQPVEVIINHIDKTTVRGYVSEPKYRATDKAAASIQTPAAPVTTNSAQAVPPSDPKLAHRDEPVSAH